ncbi:MAG: uroporphyrinogen-III synthase [Alphaproteobacteria bacterium]|nr:uroporphyrinogen-III synthase [Alphaproteobacteria bacterium]
MRLLVTRPISDALVLAEQLARHGHDVLVSPMIDIIMDPRDRAEGLPATDAQGGLAFTSANGVRALMAHLNPDTHPDWLALPSFAVGPQTAQALAAAGFSKIHTANGDLPALADLVSAHYKSDLPILHIAGRDRAGDLAALLSQKSIILTRAVLYRAKAATDFSLAAQAALGDDDEPVEAVVLYSQRSADIFCALFAALNPPPSRRPKAYCLSEPIAQAMRAADFEAIAPPDADSDALIALLSV